MNKQVARLSGRLAELEHLGAGYLFQCARNSALALVPIYALSLQSACTAVMHAAVACSCYDCLPKMSQSKILRISLLKKSVSGWRKKALILPALVISGVKCSYLCDVQAEPDCITIQTCIVSAVSNALINVKPNPTPLEIGLG